MSENIVLNPPTNLQYSKDDLIEDGNWKGKNEIWKKSKFDEMLTSKWNEAVEKGIFKYKLDDCKYRFIKSSNTDPLPCVAQLNPQRSFNRRKRETFETMNEKFSYDQFNFTKIKNSEILFSLSPTTGSATYELQGNNALNYVVVNISPIDYGHVLLIPELDKCKPQRLTASSLLLAFDFLQLSANPGFRVGFNSLHAWASVNHLHFHGMYLQHELFIDHIPASEHVMGSCYLIDSASPMHALVFNIPQQEHQRIQVAKEIEKLVDLLHEVEIPYNVMINRGSHGLRCIVVPRTSTKDRDLSPIFDMACVEIGGQFPIKSENEFCKLTHDLAFKILKSNGVDDEKFNSLVEKFKTGHA